VKCRRCSQPVNGDAVYMDERNKPSITPACPWCYELQIMDTDEFYKRTDQVQYAPGRAQREYEGGYVE
jgi:hypothetical protein